MKRSSTSRMSRWDRLLNSSSGAYLEMVILRHGENVEVAGPEELRNAIERRLQAARDRYRRATASNVDASR